MTRRSVLVLGEGTAVGLIIGAALGGWEVWLNADLHHGMRWLAMSRLAGPMARDAAWGALLSAAVALALSGLGRRGRRLLSIGVGGLVVVWAAALVALAFPLRDTILLLHRFSDHGLTWAVLGAIAVASLLLLAARAWDALVSPEETKAGRLRHVLAVLAIVSGGSVVMLWSLLPRLSSARAAGRPSIILVSIDTLRADRLGVLGSARSLTPRLDGLAKEGMVFEQAMSAAPWTLPSHASLFASRLPFDQRRHWDYHRVVPLHQTMLAERLREAGYRTLAVTGGGYVSSLCGFGQGFEVYEDHDELVEGGPETIAAAALARVRAVRGAPFFLFVHTYEPHSPYVHADLADPADAGRLPRVVSYEAIEAIHRGDLTPTEAERRYVKDLYDGDVAYVDRVIGEFLRTLKGEGILDKVLLIVLSDHGEGLWDREPDYSPDHGQSLYQELLHVPLMARWPGRVPAGSAIRTPVSLMDVAPTILEIAGLPADPDQQGRSLARTMRTGEEPTSRPILAEAIEYGPDRIMMREGTLKVVLTPDPARFNMVPIAAPPLEVFDLAADPRERHDLSARLTKPEAGMVDTLWRRAREVMADPSRDHDEAPPLPEDLLQQLRSLGYLH